MNPVNKQINKKGIGRSIQPFPLGIEDFKFTEECRLPFDLRAVSDNDDLHVW